LKTAEISTGRRRADLRIHCKRAPYFARRSRIARKNAAASTSLIQRYRSSRRWAGNGPFGHEIFQGMRSEMSKLEGSSLWRILMAATEQTAKKCIFLGGGDNEAPTGITDSEKSFCSLRRTHCWDRNSMDTKLWEKGQEPWHLIIKRWAIDIKKRDGTNRKRARRPVARSRAGEKEKEEKGENNNYSTASKNR